MVEAQSAGPVESKPMVNNFSRNILKRVVGTDRANAAFQSVSMGAIPNASSFNTVPKTASAGLIQKAQSLNEINGKGFQNRLRDKIQKAAEKVNANKTAGKSGIEAFIVDEDSDESKDSFEEANEEGALNLMVNNTDEDPSKLIDLELVNLLRYCHELKSH